MHIFGLFTELPFHWIKLFHSGENVDRISSGLSSGWGLGKLYVCDMEVSLRRIGKKQLPQKGGIQH